MRGLVLATLVLIGIAGCDDGSVQRSLSTGPSPTNTAPSAQGRVIDATTAAAVVGATITLQGKSTTTGPTGLFVLQNLVAGPATLVISHPLYITLETAFEIPTSSSQVTEFRLTPR